MAHLGILSVSGLIASVRRDYSQRYFSYFLLFVFSLVERKNEQQMKKKNHAAAGKIAFESERV
jgi:hypothetical protein